MYSVCCSKISFTSGSEINFEEECSESAINSGLRRPRPPSLAGSANKLWSALLGGGIPVKEGMNFQCLKVVTQVG